MASKNFVQIIYILDMNWYIIKAVFKLNRMPALTPNLCGVITKESFTDKIFIERVTLQCLL